MKYGKWPVVNEYSNFTVQTGETSSGGVDYTNSPTFTGTISELGTNKRMDDGSFNYQKDGQTAKCNEDGAVSD